MIKFSKICENGQPVDLGVTPLTTDLVYLTENYKQVGSLLLVYEDQNASVFSLEVLTPYRKKGYGRRLMEKAIKRCEEKGCSILTLNTEIDNDAANNLYQSMGFEFDGIKSGFNSYKKSIH